MPTTTNNGWTIPADTDLVKDGAAAIRTLGNAIDSTLGVYGASGFVKLNTTSFTGVSSVSLANNTFTSTYDHYKIILTLSSITGTNPTFYMRFRASGTDASGSNYFSGGVLTYRSGSPGSWNDNPQTSINLGGINTGSYSSYELDFMNPAQARNHQYFVWATAADSTALYGAYKAGTFDVATAHDSATFAITNGNMTGSYSVYGYAK